MCDVYCCSTVLALSRRYVSAQLVLPTVCQREVGFSLWASPTLLATTRVVCVTGLTSQIHFSPASGVIGQQVLGALSRL